MLPEKFTLFVIFQKFEHLMLTMSESSQPSSFNQKSYQLKVEPVKAVSISSQAGRI